MGEACDEAFRRSELQCKWNAMELNSSQQCQCATHAVAIIQQLGERRSHKVAHTPANYGETSG